MTTPVLPHRTLVGFQPRRCPHCGVASPAVSKVWQQSLGGTNRRGNRVWTAFHCASCGGVILTVNPIDSRGNIGQEIESVFPQEKVAHEDIPPVARKYLQQAIDTIFAPDASAVMAGSAVDAMLKELNYTEGSVYSRVEQAWKDHKLTEGMKNWAHEVRLGANRPRHADSENPHVSPQEARQAVEFAEALGQFLFVLSAKVDRGIAAAKSAS
ncbi:MAG: DUF4145 domain-containing protein [Phreatobacter sp.]|uniref:DUF4145 domain-containing protein n=1 Tax=Phreatobacter sp. TaxID=1966341 RepID=UPI0040352A26